MTRHGFIRVAAASPRVSVADCAANRERILDLMRQAQAEAVDVLVFPELCLTGYTCGDLFLQAALRQDAANALVQLARDSRDAFGGLAVVGLPLAVDNLSLNCAAVLWRGRILGLVPKSFIPNYKEFYEARWFAPASAAPWDETLVALGGQQVPLGTRLLFEAEDFPDLVVGVEICEDLWMPIPPSCFQALAGATLLLNPSASNELIAKADYRRQLVLNQSGRCLAAYAYAGCGVWESTTDLVFGGHCLIADNAVLLAETPVVQRREHLLTADVDVERLRQERQRTGSYGASSAPIRGQAFRRLSFRVDRPALSLPLRRRVEAQPFVPGEAEQLRERCEEIFHIQTCGLARRLEHLGRRELSLGVSGGLDSTLALLVACRALDALGWPRALLRAFTMPGFGTTERTLANARELMARLGVSSREADIRPLCLEEMRLLGHRPFGIDLSGLGVDGLTARLRALPRDGLHDLVFENVQARMRTSILMNAGFVIGTGDLSELALGWCTYNGDHMSMYNPNSGIPKTLVRFLVRWAARAEFEGETRRALLDVADTAISPELLPAGDGGAMQDTESAIGPYELHDFFLFHLVRHGSTPEKVLLLASQARFERDYPPDEVRRWLRVFLERFFASQYKRSCLPDGPKVGSVSLSPRGDWRMPSDASARAWLDRLDQASSEDRR